MEEKLKAPDSQSGDSEVRLFRRCQELRAVVQEKENVIAQLEQQLEEQVISGISGISSKLADAEMQKNAEGDAAHRLVGRQTRSHTQTDCYITSSLTRNRVDFRMPKQWRRKQLRSRNG